MHAIAAASIVRFTAILSYIKLLLAYWGPANHRVAIFAMLLSYLLAIKSSAALNVQVLFIDRFYLSLTYTFLPNTMAFWG